MRNQGIIPGRAAPVSTFGPGGQVYAASLVGGIKLKSGIKSYTFFDIAESSNDPWAKVLTNLKEAGKIGNSMNYIGKQYALRFSKVDGSVTTAAEQAALIEFIMGSRVELYVGSNQTKVSEIDCSHFLNVVNSVSIDANSATLPINQSAWMALPGQMQQGLTRNTEISGALFCNLPTGTPAALDMLDAVNPKFICKFVIAGEKQTK